MDTRTRTTPTTTGIDGLLPLLWLASPALPVGGFSYSEGLEAAVDAGLVTNEAQAAEWLAQQLHLAQARADLVVVKRVVADAAQAGAMNEWVLRTRETSELRQQTVQMGRSMGEWMKNVQQAQEREMTYPVAWATAVSRFGVAPRDALHAFAFGWAENMVQAAVRVVPLGQNAGQRILSRLAHEIPVAVEAALACDEPQSFSPMLAILSSRHETQYSRLFRS
jgi:urease accessory protein